MTKAPDELSKISQRKDVAASYGSHLEYKFGATQAFMTLIVFGNPAAVVQAVSLIFSPNWMNAVAFVVLIIGAYFVIDVIMIHVYDGKIWHQILNGCLYKFDKCTFEPIEIELKQHGVKNTGFSKVLQSRLMLKGLFETGVFTIRAFYIDPRSKSPVLPSTLTTYSMGSNTSYVFLSQKLDDMDFRSKFKLFHEIGHAHVTNHMIKVRGWFATVHFCLVFVFVAFHRQAGILTIMIAGLLASFWVLYWINYMLPRANTEDRVEIVADTFALVQLSERSDFRSGVCQLARDLRQRSAGVPFSRYQAWLLVRRAQFLTKTRADLSSQVGKGQDWFEQLVLPFTFWPSILIVFSILWLGATLSIGTLEELLALTLAWVVIPGVGYYYYAIFRPKRPITSQARHDAVKFLNCHRAKNFECELTVFDLL